MKCSMLAGSTPQLGLFSLYVHVRAVRVPTPLPFPLFPFFYKREYYILQGGIEVFKYGTLKHFCKHTTILLQLTTTKKNA